MTLSSRSIAVLVSLAIAAIVSAFLFFSNHLTFPGFMISIGVSFVVIFLIVYFSFESLIFREVTNIYANLENIKDLEFGKVKHRFLFRPDPLMQMKDEIYHLAEQKQKEIDELKRLQTLRREFLADVSHELKTPIFAAQGFIHTLLDGAMDDENVRHKFLEKAAKSLDGLDMLVQDLITISQLEKGVVTLNKTNFDIKELGREVFEQLSQKATNRKVALHLEEPTRRIMVFADRNRVKQVLINLIDNAIKYGRENGNIWLSFAEGKKKFTVKVKDDGEGMAKEHLNRIFERFYRIDKSRSRERGEGGSGLGLAISKHIVEAHKSVIVVDSDLGKGTTLRLKLPKAK
ncbi:MAG: HAMP domain-containing histidine kinase [Hymenobacteraceae bacterium]|nr:HAMP domain-containing histidine kinase [Hymenobacteraceae bacterium]MDX5396258.1 HAMP domain-containing histidine kinase [Hymenobacteraceae bacterium]MDX5512321.1 HAMP domain-containing histidine kinase [Hymenobacteraceae bacterium]